MLAFADFFSNDARLAYAHFRFMATTAKIASSIVASKRERRQSTISFRILRVILFFVKIALSDIGIPINKYAFLNIVYFGLAYI